MRPAIVAVSLLSLVALPVEAAHAGNWKAHGSLRFRRREAAKGFVTALEFKRRLRVCNAFPYDGALDVYRGRLQKLTGDTPMPYKSCRDFASPLESGDKLEFKVGDASAGSFSVSDLPNNDAVMLLVVHRHDALSSAVSFESHVFSNLLNAQIAVIDTYKGAAKADPSITDARSVVGEKGSSRREQLRYNSVVAVNQGIYDVELTQQDGEVKARTELVAVNHESYVILRTGVESHQGQAYPQELFVFPKSDRHLLPSGTATKKSFLLLLLCVAASLHVVRPDE